MTCGAENLLTSCGRIACRRHEEAERSGTPPDLHSRPQASLLAAAEKSPLSPQVARRQRSGTPPVRPRSHSPTKRISGVLSAARGAPLRHPTWTSAPAARLPCDRDRLARMVRPASPPPRSVKGRAAEHPGSLRTGPRTRPTCVSPQIASKGPDSGWGDEVGPRPSADQHPEDAICRPA